MSRYDLRIRTPQVFAPHGTLRAAVTSAHRSVWRKGQGAAQAADPSVTPRHVAMCWAHRLNRVCDIDTCARCGDKLKVIASIEEAQANARILSAMRMNLRF